MKSIASGIEVPVAIDPAWPVLLFKRSALKQRKFEEIASFLGETDQLRCLDIGSDNGVISYLFRKRGGNWKSADLDHDAVQSIRALVKDDVFHIEGSGTRFQDNEFDKVVIVVFLEHIKTDREFIKELFRVIKPGGELIINVPHIKNSLLRKFRLAIGQTDEKHGHVRPGYTIDGLMTLLKDTFTIASYRTYSKFFSELIDTLMTFGFGVLKKGKTTTRKGVFITGHDLGQYQKLFRVYSFIYPVVWLFTRLDALLFWSSGYMLIVKAKIKKRSP